MEHKHHRCQQAQPSRVSIIRTQTCGTRGWSSAYRAPDVSFHCNEPTGRTSGPRAWRWRCMSASWHHWHREHPCAPLSASCPLTCIWAQDRWMLARPRRASPCRVHNFRHSLRGPVFCLSMPSVRQRVCWLWGIAQKVASCSPWSIKCERLLLRLCWGTWPQAATCTLLTLQRGA